MPSRERPGSKTRSQFFNKKSRVNKKKDSSDKGLNPSLLKKNEFALILLGALLLSILIFFFFFRSSDTESEIAKQDVSAAPVTAFEKRIENIEKVLKIGADSRTKNVNTKESAVKINHLEDRLGRLETAFSVKFDSLIDRVGVIENRIAQLKNKPVKTVVKKETAPEPAPAVPVKKAVKKKFVFHTVKKKETLYSISKQYNTTIDKLRELNKLSKGAIIYPGDNLLVR